MSEPTKADLYSLLETVMDAIITDADGWHPNPEVDQDNWNEDAMMGIQLTIKECRKIKEALIADRRLPKHWTGQGDTLLMCRLAKQEEEAFYPRKESDEE